MLTVVWWIVLAPEVVPCLSVYLKVKTFDVIVPTLYPFLRNIPEKGAFTSVTVLESPMFVDSNFMISEKIWSL